MAPASTPARMTVGPISATGTPPKYIAAAIEAGGGELVEPSRAEGVVWADPVDVGGLRAFLAGAPAARWVQLPYAGVEAFAAAGVLSGELTWTAAKGVYAEPVAEHALALALACLRRLPTYGRATTWGRPAGRNLYDSRVTVLGGGGITEGLLPMLAPFRPEVTVVRRSAEPLPGATSTVDASRLMDALAAADLVVLALALTPQTTGIIDKSALAAMPDHACVVNVARGRHIVTDDLIEALQEGSIGGAGLDVTDPEPLPDGHPLWTAPNCIVTPHTGNTPEMARPLLARRIAENVRRFGAGEPLIGVVDPEHGY